MTDIQSPVLAILSGATEVDSCHPVVVVGYLISKGVCKFANVVPFK